MWQINRQTQMKERRVLISALFIILLSIQTFSQTDDLKNNHQEELEKILKKCAEYCEKLSHSVLDFTCNEKIAEEIRSGKPGIMGVQINSYVYDYQLIRRGITIDEKRILVKENGQKTNIIVAQLKTKRFRHKHVVLGPIGLLGQRQQEVNEYKILKEVIYEGERTVIIEAIPKYTNELNVLYGKAWIRKKDFSILKIEWEQESLENIEGIEKIAKRLNAKPIITFVSEYAYEKNEIRFPSKYSVDELYILSNGNKYNRSRLSVIYDNYNSLLLKPK